MAEGVGLVGVSGVSIITIGAEAIVTIYLIVAHPLPVMDLFIDL